MKLPLKYTETMKALLGAEYDAYLASFDEERFYGLRVNTLKISAEEMAAKGVFSLRPVPWCETGFYYDGAERPAKHPYYHAGLYYLQEPSAMSPAATLPIGEGDRVLDLCAAPGGKTTQLGARLGGTGLLVANDISAGRAKTLLKNVELAGIRNAIVMSETPERIAERLPHFFDKILVDAPCSGEGMFRKNEAACEEWNPENVRLCAERQDGILDCAASMLAPGGRIVYSTCTFAPAENEGSMTRFLLRHPEFHIVEVKKAEGMSAGVPEWAYFGEKMGQVLPEIAQTIRLWPQHLKGEGHYLAVLEKEGTLRQGYCRNGEEKGIPAKDLKVPGKGIVEFLDFAKDTFDPQTLAGLEKNGTYLKFGDQLYLAPKGMPSVKGLKVLRPGLHLGTVKKNRMEPSHALALALKKEQVRYTADLASDGEVIRGYLNGGTFSYEGEKGWYLIMADGFSSGWGKLAGGIMKNHYPKGLRKMW